MKLHFRLAAAALGLAAVPATSATSAEPAPAAQEARIPFVAHGGIRDWRAEDGDTIYLQDRARRWYRAELMHHAHGLPFAWTIGFETRRRHVRSLLVGRGRGAARPGAFAGSHRRASAEARAGPVRGRLTAGRPAGA